MVQTSRAQGRKALGQVEWLEARLGEGQRREIRPGEKQRERSAPPGGPRTGVFIVSTGGAVSC